MYNVAYMSLCYSWYRDYVTGEKCIFLCAFLAARAVPCGEGIFSEGMASLLLGRDELELIGHCS